MNQEAFREWLEWLAITHYREVKVYTHIGKVNHLESKAALAERIEETWIPTETLFAYLFRKLDDENLSYIWMNKAGANEDKYFLKIHNSYNTKLAEESGKSLTKVLLTAYQKAIQAVKTKEV